jgi:hypothetical protein
MAITGDKTSWNWQVSAKGATGKQQTSKSPNDKIICRYHFWPDSDGLYRFTVPISFSGEYDVSADQVGAGGRQATVEIKLFYKASHRGKGFEFSKTILRNKVTKGASRGPFKVKDNLIVDVQATVGKKPSETANREVVLTLRVQLYAFAKWRHSRASLNFAKLGSTGIKFGPATVTRRK